MQKIKLFVFLDILGQKLIRTQEPNISFSFKVIVELSIFDKFVFLELLFFYEEISEFFNQISNIN
ncbi:peptide deformylase domain protein [Rickettsia rhipicephali str. Ect]|uniref:Peptide deformylase domain protein n=2 Tax=spotted fever group TaxID=114277 RepID=A0A0F3PD89_RICRH|nr:hypothetical protein RMB_01495 [Rickettsia massiliae str. AZT80]KJV78258.1 peptide deformylase domain protein [Rickettsia rhipicephali str. Ect]